jgi:DUF1009 family protein
MSKLTPDSIGIIAGKGAYPRILAESARKQGVKRIFAVAFKKETGVDVEKYADEVEWVYIGQLRKMLEAFSKSGIKHVVMAGQITPTSLFKVRMDSQMLNLLKQLPAKNAETIFGAVGNELCKQGIELIPASSFMEEHMPVAGLLSCTSPSEKQQADIELGLQVAKTTSKLDIGQTVVIKEGTILAVEAFEGTNEAIKRAASLSGPGAVIVKVAKHGHDMRFDIPVVGLDTIKLLKKVKASVLAIEAGRSIILEREKVIAEADKIGLCLTAVNTNEWKD